MSDADLADLDRLANRLDLERASIARIAMRHGLLIARTDGVHAILAPERG